jgi:D-alanyl-D-alanine carboxypeptidase
VIRATRLRLAAVALVAFGLLLPGTAGARVEAKPRLKRVAESLVAHGVPGAVVVVRDQAGVRGYAAGYANVAAKQRMTPQAGFRIGSLTKTFVATVMLQLAGEGRLGLDDTVERWLPGLVPGGVQITLRQLLNHSSGIYNYTDDQSFWASERLQPRRVWAPEELVRTATAHPPLFAPGTSWSYSNTNYIVLGLVVESVTQRTVAQELEQRIFRPLGLTATSLPSTRTMTAPFAHGYVGRGNELIPGTSRARRFDVTSRFDPSWAWTAGAIVSNGVDLTRFYAALLSGELLSPAQLAEMTKTFRDSGYGLGIGAVKSPCGVVWGHSGAVPGYLTVILTRDGGRHVGLVMVNWDSVVHFNDAADAAACAA